MAWGSTVLPGFTGVEVRRAKIALFGPVGGAGWVASTLQVPFIFQQAGWASPQQGRPRTAFKVGRLKYMSTLPASSRATFPKDLLLR